MKYLLAVCLVLSLCLPALAGDQEKYAVAYAQALDTKKPLVVFLTRQDCPPCERLQRLLQSTDTSTVVLVALEINQSAAAKSIAKSQITPRLHFFAYVDGRLMLKQIEGFLTGTELDEFLAQ